jgi:methyl-accepting chemotaxis protein
LKFKGLKKELVFQIGLPVIIIFIVAILVLRFSLNSQVQKSADQQIQLQASKVDYQTEVFFHDYLEWCQMLAANEQIKAMVADSIVNGTYYENTAQYSDVVKTMTEQTALYPAIMQSYVGGIIQNDLVLNEGTTMHNANIDIIVKDRVWAATALEGNVCYMPPYEDAITGNTVTTISAPLYIDGKPSAAVGIDLMLNDAQDIFANSKIGETGFVMVILPDGTVFYHPNEDYVGQAYTDIGLSEEGVELVEGGETGDVVSFEMDGTDYVGTLTTIEGAEWSLITCMTEKEAYATTRSMTIQMIAILGIALLVILGTIYYIIGLVVRPIAKLVVASKKLAQGDVNIDCDHKDIERDEVDQMVNAFAEVVENNKKQAESLNKLANGDTTMEIDVRSDADLLNVALKKVVNTINALINETAELTQNAALGNTAYRGNAEKFNGGYKQIIEGFNSTIDVIMAEVNVFSDVITQLGDGQLPEVDHQAQGDYVKIIESLKASVNTLKNLVGDTQGMVSAAVGGDYTKRVDVANYRGEFEKIVSGINKTLDEVVEKTAWYENIINSIPLPVQVMDGNQNWTLVNTAFFNQIRAAKPSIAKPDDIYGQRCHIEGANINGIDEFNRGNADTRMEFQGKSYMQTTAVLKDTLGNGVGYVGTWQDLTSILKSNEFSENEIARLQGNLGNLARGKFEFTESTQVPDEYTQAAADQFKLIDASLNEVADAVGKLIKDTKAMSDAAVAGDLASRIDVAAHEGEYAAVVAGINSIVDAILAPISETLLVLQDVAAGNLQHMVTGDYKGGHAQTKDALNNTITHLRDVIADISRVLTAIADGDLTVNADEAKYLGDFTAIKDATNSITYKLRDVMKGLNDSSEQVANGSRQLSEAAQTLANGSTQQASAIQQLTATVSDIANQTSHNAENAREASRLATGVKSSAERGDGQMKEMLVSMDEINESSANISKIIKVIDDIAFQTNILALNAAVEAARAGVHGKGFAVVADEVRSLAAKSAAAASETTALIEGSISKVEAGTKIANETAEALAEIVEGIGKTADLVDSIASASGEQAVGINEVNKGIEQVSQVVQSNSATAEESAASSEELYGQADMLKKMVAAFHVDSRKGGAAPAQRKPAAPPQLPPTKEDVVISLDFDENDKY